MRSVGRAFAGRRSLIHRSDSLSIRPNCRPPSRVSTVKPLRSLSGLEDETTPATAPSYRAGPPLPPSGAWQLRVTSTPGPRAMPSEASPRQWYSSMPGYLLPAG